METPHRTVTELEAGQKLLRFLIRHLATAHVAGQDGTRLVSTTDLHRWIRTGQVRVNKGRVKAFHLLQVGDRVRIPPFVLFAAASVTKQHKSLPCLTIVQETTHLVLINKPTGLATQPGTGQSDSVVDRLAQHYAAAPLLPAPVHRLDKETSGLLLAGKSHQALQWLSQLFAQASNSKQGTNIHKEYLAWVHGSWLFTGPQQLRDTLEKSSNEQGYESVKPRQSGGQEAVSEATLLEQRQTQYGTVSLLRLHLLTGRTHQLRVQLAARGFPIVGDKKYGIAIAFPQLLLHAWHLALRATDAQERELLGGNVLSIYSPPEWEAPFSVSTDLMGSKSSALASPPVI